MDMDLRKVTIGASEERLLSLLAKMGPSSRLRPLVVGARGPLELCRRRSVWRRTIHFDADGAAGRWNADLERAFRDGAGALDLVLTSGGEPFPDPLRQLLARVEAGVLVEEACAGVPFFEARAEQSFELSIEHEHEPRMFSWSAESLHCHVSWALVDEAGDVLFDGETDRRWDLSRVPSETVLVLAARSIAPTEERPGGRRAA